MADRLIRIDLDPPVQVDVTCRHCCQPLVAIALLTDTTPPRPVWSHADGKQECRPVRHAEPQSGWQAGLLVAAVVDSRRASEQALAEALGEGER